MKTSRRRTIGSSITNGRMRIIYVRDSIRVLPSFLKEVLGTEAISASVSFRNWTFCRHASKCSRCVSAAYCRLVELDRVTWIFTFNSQPNSRNSIDFLLFYPLLPLFLVWCFATSLVVQTILFLSVKFLVTCNLVYSVLNNITSQLYLLCAINNVSFDTTLMKI